MNWNLPTKKPEPRYFVLLLLEVGEAIFDEFGDVSHFNVYDDIVRGLWDGEAFIERPFDQPPRGAPIECNLYARKVFVKGWVYIPSFAKEIKEQFN